MKQGREGWNLKLKSRLRQVCEARQRGDFKDEVSIETEGLLSPPWIEAGVAERKDEVEIETEGLWSKAEGDGI